MVTGWARLARCYRQGMIINCHSQSRGHVRLAWVWARYFTTFTSYNTIIQSFPFLLLFPAGFLKKIYINKYSF